MTIHRYADCSEPQPPEEEQNIDKNWVEDNIERTAPGCFL
jgi:hypothetical protein